MCYHYSLAKNQEALLLQLMGEWEIPFDPVFHAGGFTFPVMPVITQEAPGRIQAYSWGLIPSWVRSREEALKMRTHTLNARAESIWEKPAFRGSVTNHRCLVPADGFFEWMEFRKKKYPHHIRLKSGEIFAFAGLYNHWTDRETGELFRSFCIITTEANPFMARIHNTKHRMPVILQQQQWAAWLDPTQTQESLREMLTACPDSDLEAITIGREIGRPGADTNHPATLGQVDYPELHSGEQFSLFDL